MGIRMRSIIIGLLLVLLPVAGFSLPVFPGAEGFGTATVGGRGGAVIKVTNLNDSGAGSFRAACEASGARIVVFAVSGDIHTTTQLNITNPYITIAGQTSPGGISVSGRMFQISTHDVLITHMRFRRGTDECFDSNGAEAGNDSCSGGFGDTVRIMNQGDNDAYNIVFDHCSIEWGADETLDISSYNGDETTSGETWDVTVSNSIIGQGCNGPDTGMESNHALGVVISNVYKSASGRDITVSMHHNYVNHFKYRFPNIAGAQVDLYNNVIYNWGEYTGQIGKADTFLSGTARNPYGRGGLNSRHNYWKEGPSTGYWDGCRHPQKSLGHVYDYDGTGGILTGTPSAMVHNNGNMGSCYADGTTRNGIYRNGYDGTAEDVDVASGWVSATPLANATTGTPTITTMTSAYASQVVAAAGANRIASSASLFYDTVDAQILADYEAGTGSWITFTNYPTDWPTYSTANDNPTDSDSDGMWDTQEAALFGDITKDGTADTDSDGYTDFEEYLFSLGGYAAAPLATSPACTGCTGVGVTFN